MAFVTPKGLQNVAAVLLGTALLVLAAFTVYVWQRRRLRAVGARSRRGKGNLPMQSPMVDAELIIDDLRRGSRPGPRRQLPWPLALFSVLQRPALFPDAPRGFSFNLGIWKPAEEPAEPARDDVADSTSYIDGLSNAAGPRFMATTASGKSLQVVVKTAAVTSRQQQTQQEQLQNQQEQNAFELDAPMQHTRQAYASSSSDGSVGRQLLPSSRQGMPPPGASLLETMAPSLLSSPTAPGAHPYTADGNGAIGSSMGLGLRGAGAEASSYVIPPSSKADGPRPRLAAAIAAEALLDSDREGSNDGSASSLNLHRHPDLHRHSQSGGAHVGSSSESSWQEPNGTALEFAETAQAGGDKGSKAAFVSGGPSGRGGNPNPAAAWYNRALHRQVSAAAAAAQAAGGTSKAHLA